MLKMNSYLKKHALSCLGIILLGLFAYMGTTPFLVDAQVVPSSPTMAESSWIEKMFSQPVLAAFFASTRALSGAEVGGTYAVNLGIHLAVGLLFYFLVRQWILLAPPEQRAGLGPHNAAA